MKDILRQHIIKRLGRDTGNIDTVLDCFSEHTIKRNSMLLEQGTICKYVYFVAKGCLQVFVYDNDMNETTRDIVTEGNWCTELMSFGKQIPASENIKAIEHTQTLAIHKYDFDKLIHDIPQFDMVYKQILETSYANSVYRINSFVSMTAIERIKWMHANRSDVMTRVSSKIIASYLGIHKDVYSRLKSKM